MSVLFFDMFSCFSFLWVSIVMFEVLDGLEYFGVLLLVY